MSTATTHLFPSITATIRAKLASVRERLSYWGDLRYSTSAMGVADAAWSKAHDVGMDVIRTQSNVLAQGMAIANAKTGIECLQKNVVDNACAIQGLQAGASISMARHELTQQNLGGLLRRVQALESENETFRTVARRMKYALELLDETEQKDDDAQLDLFKPVPQTDDRCDDAECSDGCVYGSDACRSVYGTNIFHLGRVS